MPENVGKWTKGPWRVFGKNTGYIAAPDGVDGKSIVQVAEVGSYRDGELLPYNRERWDADAHLIAAAPDLAEAARIAIQLASIASDWNLDEVEIDGEMRHIYDVKDIFRAALAKARGES